MNWSPGQTIELLEKEAIQGALRYHGGNKTRTAEALGIAIRTLDNKLLIYKEQENAAMALKVQQQQAKLEQIQRARGITQTVQYPQPEEVKAMNLVEIRESAKAARRQKALQK